MSTRCEPHKEITGETEFIVIGSASVLGQYPKKAEPLAKMTDEVDLYPRHHAEQSGLLNAIGRYSSFHNTHGFSVDPVGPETARLPTGWEERLIPVSTPNTNGAVGWCLEVHDVAVSKLFAGRQKDHQFVQILLDHQLAERHTIQKRIRMVPNVEHSQIQSAEAALLKIIVNISHPRKLTL